MYCDSDLTGTISKICIVVYVMIDNVSTLSWNDQYQVCLHSEDTTINKDPKHITCESGYIIEKMQMHMMGHIPVHLE